MGVSPRGLRPNMLWQMDVMHVPSFGKLSFVHVTVDTFSHVIIATARTGEHIKMWFNTYLLASPISGC